MAEKMAELEKKVELHERRIAELEKIIKSKRPETPQQEVSEESNFKGLSGGLRFLISRRFLDSPKGVNEILDELKKEGYHYSYESVSKILSVNFMQKQKIVTRIKEENLWKYVLRK